MFADGTPADGTPFPIDTVPVKKILAVAAVRAPPKKIAPNPSAATVSDSLALPPFFLAISCGRCFLDFLIHIQVHMREAGKPWREAVERSASRGTVVLKS